jgi:hypothetical protein
VAGAQHRSEWFIDAFQQVDRERLRIPFAAELGGLSSLLQLRKRTS